MTGPAPQGAKFTERIPATLKRRRTVLIVAGLLLAALAAYFFWSGRASKNVSYLTDNVVTGDVMNTITASGTVESENTVPLIFKNSAVIKAIYVKEGQRVKKGDLLAEQDDRDLQAQYDQQAASLKAAEAKLSLARAGARQEDIRQSEESYRMAEITRDQAKAAFDRNTALFDAGALSRADRDKSESDYSTAEAKLSQAREQLSALKAGNRPEDILVAESSVEQARAQLQTAGNNLEAARITAPDDGFIGQIGAVVGQRTNGVGSNSSSADGFITLISDRFRVRAQVNEADVGRTVVGQKAFFTVNSYPDRKFPGTVESISPKAITVSNVQLYEVVIALEKQEPDLKVGMPANVSIIADQRSGVTLVPKIAMSYAAKNAGKFSAEGGGGTAERQSQQAGGGEARAQRAQGGAQGTQGAQGARAGQGPQGALGTGASANSGAGKEMPVLVMDKGKPALRTVRVGISDTTNYEVLSGLKEGDQVVIGSTAETQPAGTQRQGQGGGQAPLMGAPRIGR